MEGSAHHFQKIGLFKHVYGSSFIATIICKCVKKGRMIRVGISLQTTDFAALAWRLGLAVQHHDVQLSQKNRILRDVIKLKLVHKIQLMSFLLYNI